MRQYSALVPKSIVLNSWKEIAAYVGRGVRTVQRWEHDFNLPVHRPKGRDRSAVLAFPVELEHWLMNTPMRGPGGDPGHAALSSNICGIAVERARELRKRSHVLMADIHDKAETQQARAEKLTKTLQNVMTRMQDACRNGQYRQAG